MSRMLLALLVCLPALALGSTIKCRFGEKVLNPGETHVIEENCARHTCTCDPTKSGSNMCRTVKFGCHNPATNTCYKSGDTTTIYSDSGSPMQCVCQQNAGSFWFADCRSETCKDSRTNEEKKKGEPVNHVIDGVNYVCTCAGTEGYQNCYSEESIRNEGKCLDLASGSYVSVGSAATTKEGDTIWQCTCSGTNAYSNCRTSTCADVDGSAKKAGEKVTVMDGNDLLICDCAGLEGYQNCRSQDSISNEGKCLDIVSGRHVPVGSTATTMHGDTILYCTCSSTNSYSNCKNPNKCRDVEGRYVNKGQRFRAQYGDKKYDCLCDGNNSGKKCSVV